MAGWPTTRRAHTNPCVRCNGSVRLDAMLELAGRLGRGAWQPATMPASRTVPGPAAADCSRPAEGPELCPQLAGSRLPRSPALPLGDMDKVEVRRLAAAAASPWPADPIPRISASCRHGTWAFLERHGTWAAVPAHPRYGGLGPRRAPRRPPLHGRPAPWPGHLGTGARLRPGHRRSGQHGHRRSPPSPACGRHAGPRGHLHREGSLVDGVRVRLTAAACAAPSSTA